MPELLIHVGSHKTGSTAIQKFLFDNKEVLASSGICYFEPVPIKSFALHHNLCLGLLQESLLEMGIEYQICWFKESKYFHNVGLYFQDLIEYMDENALQKAIISSEGLFGTAKVFCNGLISDFPRKLTNEEARQVDNIIIKKLRKYTYRFDTKIVVYLRRQDKHFNSLYSHYLDSLTFTQVMAPVDFLLCNPHEYNYASELDLWSKSFGKKNIYPYVFGKEILKSGITSHFVENILGLNLEGKLLLDTRINEHKSKTLLEFINRLSVCWPSDKISFQNLDSFKNSKQNSPDYKSHSYFLDQTTEKKFIDSLEESNIRLGKDYFNSDESPFESYQERTSCTNDNLESFINLSRELAVYYEYNIIAITRKLQETESMVDELNGTLGETRNILKKKQEEFEERFNQLTSDVKDKEKLIRDLQYKLGVAEHKLLTLDQVLISKQDDIEKLKARLAETEFSNIAFTKNLGAEFKERLNQLTLDVKNKENLICDLQYKLGVAEHKLLTLDQFEERLNQLTLDVKDKENLIHDLQCSLEDAIKKESELVKKQLLITNSMSWRVTVPLRVIKSKIKSIFRKIE